MDHENVAKPLLRISAIAAIILLGSAVQQGVDLPAPLRWAGMALVVGLIVLGVAREPTTVPTLRRVNWTRVAIVSLFATAIAAALLCWKN
ncbi:hypothetical protein [Fontivita pretiosa]|uniref:hypothetical protein n=1 Tax=Fontivita pretiosa TaxID=2989684 RepID=UPI003D16C4B1